MKKLIIFLFSFLLLINISYGVDNKTIDFTDITEVSGICQWSISAGTLNASDDTDQDTPDYTDIDYKNNCQFDNGETDFSPLAWTAPTSSREVVITMNEGVKSLRIQHSSGGAGNAYSAGMALKFNTTYRAYNASSSNPTGYEQYLNYSLNAVQGRNNNQVHFYLDGILQHSETINPTVNTDASFTSEFAIIEGVADFNFNEIIFGYLDQVDDSYSNYLQINLTNVTDLNLNTLPECVPNMLYTLCANSEGRANFDINLNCSDDENDQIYYSLEKNSFDIGVFWLEFNNPVNDPFEQGNEYIFTEKYENQTYSWMIAEASGISWYLDSNTDHTGSLLYVYDRFINLEEDRKGITWNYNQYLNNQIPDTYFSIYMNDNSRFNFSFEDHNFDKYINYEFKSMLNGSFNMSVNGVEIDRDLLYDQWTTIKIGQDSENVSIYWCSELECATENLINTTVLDSTYRPKLFNTVITQDIISFDNYIVSYDSVRVPSNWATSTTSINQGVGTFKHRYYISDELHYLANNHTYIDLYLTVLDYEGCIDINETQQPVKSILEISSNPIVNFLEVTNSYEIGKSVIWFLYLIGIVVTSIGFYKLLGDPRVFVSMISNSFIFLLLSLFVRYWLHAGSFAFLLILGLSIVVRRDTV